MIQLAGLFKGGLKPFGLATNTVNSVLGNGNKLNPFSNLGQASADNQYHPYQAATVQGNANASIADQRGLQAQYDALDKTRANTIQGFNEAEKQNLNLGINKVNQNTQARTNAIRQDASARNLGGSGIENALRAQNEQTGANAANDAGINSQSMANQRALSSISQLGSLGGDINEQAFNRGQAQDALNMFNINAQNAAASGNAGNQLQNQQYNQGQYQQNQQFRQDQNNIRRGQNIQMAGSIIGAGGAVAGRG